MLIASEYCFRQSVTSTKQKLIVRPVSHSVCQQDYCNSNRPISLKLVLWLSLPKNRLTCGGDPVQDTDSGLDHFPLLLPLQNSRCGEIYQHFSYSRRPVLTTLGKMTDTDEVLNPQHFGSDLVDTQIRIRMNVWKSRFECQITLLELTHLVWDIWRYFKISCSQVWYVCERTDEWTGWVHCASSCQSWPYVFGHALWH